MPTLVPNSATAVSWGAILAGAAAAAALSFILMLLGLGFGLLSVSPWSGEGSSAEAIGFGAIIWLIIIHLRLPDWAVIWLAGCVPGGPMFTTTKSTFAIPPMVW